MELPAIVVVAMFIIGVGLMLWGIVGWVVEQREKPDVPPSMSLGASRTMREYDALLGIYFKQRTARRIIEETRK